MQELRDYMSDIGLKAEQEAAAQVVLEGLQSDLERFLNRPVEVRQFTETLLADGGYLFPRVTPVVSIIGIAGLTAPPGGFLYTPQTGLRVGYGGSWTVTYTAGLTGAAIPAIRLGILRVAKREMQNNHDDTLSVKDLDTTDNPKEPVGWTEEELWKFSRHRKRAIAT